MIEVDAVANAIGILEILSDATEEYDRTTKYENYKKIPTLRQYTLISQDKIQVEFSSIRSLRNSLEHFDERLDKYVKNYSGQAFFDCNVVTGTKGFPEKDFLRAIAGNTYKFYGEDFDLTEIHSRLLPLIKSLNDVQNATSH